MSHRDPICAHGHMDALFDHVAQSARFGTPQRRQPADRSPLQLPAGAHRSLRRPRRHGLAERSGLQADHGDDRLPRRIPQGHLLGRHLRQHLELVREGNPAPEAAGSLRPSRQQIRLPYPRHRTRRPRGRRRRRTPVGRKRRRQNRHHGPLPPPAASAPPNRRRRPPDPAPALLHRSRKLVAAVGAALGADGNLEDAALEPQHHLLRRLQRRHVGQHDPLRAAAALPHALLQPALHDRLLQPAAVLQRAHDVCARDPAAAHAQRAGAAVRDHGRVRWLWQLWLGSLSGIYHAVLYHAVCDDHVRGRKWIEFRAPRSCSVAIGWLGFWLRLLVLLLVLVIGL